MRPIIQNPVGDRVIAFLEAAEALGEPSTSSLIFARAGIQAPGSPVRNAYRLACKGCRYGLLERDSTASTTPIKYKVRPGWRDEVDRRKALAARLTTMAAARKRAREKAREKARAKAMACIPKRIEPDPDCIPLASIDQIVPRMGPLFVAWSVSPHRAEREASANRCRHERTQDRAAGSAFQVAMEERNDEHSRITS